MFLDVFTYYVFQFYISLPGQMEPTPTRQLYRHLQTPKRRKQGAPCCTTFYTSHMCYSEEYMPSISSMSSVSDTDDESCTFGPFNLFGGS
jgi:hypothetical protein